MSTEQRQSRVAQFEAVAEEWFEVDRSRPKFPECGRCHRPIFPQQPHRSCEREVREELSMEKERQRQNHSKLVFGEVLDQNEYYIRLYPDESYYGQETYNNRLKRLEEEKKQARLDKLKAREDRKMQLPELERKLKLLQRQIENDRREEEEESKQKP